VAADAAPPEPDHRLVDRYEQLRRYALAGHADGHRLGLAVLVGRGVAAWMHAWDALPATSPPPPPPPPAGADQLVGVLAAMALAVVRGG
jgi:hypothetical protein